jgi:hypothetical protein
LVRQGLAGALALAHLDSVKGVAGAVSTTDEREYPLIHLRAGSVRLDEETVAAIRAFEPLDFEPGHKAAAWLDANVGAGRLPMDTYLVFSEDSSELLGFFVLELIEVAISSGDLPIIELRQKLTDPQEPQPAVKLVWITRSKDSPQGFGQELFDQALALAFEAGACALLVEPYDELTAQRVWLDHYELRTPRPHQDRPEEWSYLWHAVGDVEAEWP